MEHRNLGNTGLSVSVLGFGGAEIGYEKAEQSDVDRLLGSALDHGLNVIDTAECYANSEEMIGKAIGHRRGEYHLFTKCGHNAHGSAHSDWSPELLREQLERSLALLGTDFVDLWQLHTCSEDVLRKGDVIAVLLEAKAAGKTQFIGYSGDNEESLYAVDCGAFDTLQTSINIADQRAIALTVPRAMERNMGVITKRSLANAAWWNGANPPASDYARPYWERLNALQYDFSRDYGREEIAGIALRFALTVPGVSVALIGTKNPDRWLQNSLMASTGPLTPEEYDFIRAHWDSHAGPDWVTLR